MSQWWSGELEYFIFNVTMVVHRPVLSTCRVSHGNKIPSANNSGELWICVLGFYIEDQFNFFYLVLAVGSVKIFYHLLSYHFLISLVQPEKNSITIQLCNYVINNE